MLAFNVICSPLPPLKTNQLIKERMWYRLVGSSLEVYDVKSKEDDPMYVVTEAPIAVHEVKGVTKMSDVNFRVTILSGDGGLNLFAADAVDGKGWMDALARASEWDQLTSSRKVRVRACAVDACLLALRRACLRACLSSWFVHLPPPSMRKT